MKKKLLFLPVAALFLAAGISCNGPASGDKALDISFKNTPDSKVYMYFRPFDNSGVKRDTLAIANNKVSYPIPAKAGELTVTTPGSYISFKPLYDSPILLEANKLTLILDGTTSVAIQASFEENGADYKILKGNTNKQLKDALMAIQTLNKEIDRKTREMVALGDPTNAEVHKLDKEIQTLKSADRRNLYLDYFKHNTKKPVAAYMLTKTHVDTLGKYYNELSEEARTKSIYAPELDRLFQNAEDRRMALEASETVIDGSKAPQIVCDDINEKPFDLSKISKKYTLIEFWGSWCPYCVRSFPKLKEYYAKYSDKLEIVGVNCRDTDTKWRNTVKDHELPWLHIKDARVMGDDKKIVVAYGIRVYPTLFLLDKEGTIVKRFNGVDEELYTMLDELLRN